MQEQVDLRQLLEVGVGGKAAPDTNNNTLKGWARCWIETEADIVMIK